MATSQTSLNLIILAFHDAGSGLAESGNLGMGIFGLTIKPVGRTGCLGLCTEVLLSLINLSAIIATTRHA